MFWQHAPNDRDAASTVKRDDPMVSAALARLTPAQLDRYRAVEAGGNTGTANRLMCVRWAVRHGRMTEGQPTGADPLPRREWDGVIG